MLFGWGPYLICLLLSPSPPSLQGESLVSQKLLSSPVVPPATSGPMTFQVFSFSVSPLSVSLLRVSLSPYRHGPCWCHLCLPPLELHCFLFSMQPWIYILEWDSMSTQLVQEVYFTASIEICGFCFFLVHCTSELQLVLFVLFLNYLESILSLKDVGRDSYLGGLDYLLVFLFWNASFPINSIEDGL